MRLPIPNPAHDTPFAGASKWKYRSVFCAPSGTLTATTTLLSPLPLSYVDKGTLSATVDWNKPVDREFAISLWFSNEIDQ